jgi:hypothetical protein
MTEILRRLIERNARTCTLWEPEDYGFRYRFRLRTAWVVTAQRLCEIR